MQRGRQMPAKLRTCISVACVAVVPRKAKLFITYTQHENSYWHANETKSMPELCSPFML